MPRSPRADEAGGLYYALNRRNLRAEIFTKQEDYVAFEEILAEALAIHQVHLFGYLLMPNHYHLVLRPLVDGEMSRFMGWVGRVNEPLTKNALTAVRLSAYRGRPLDDEGWVESTARQLNFAKKSAFLFPKHALRNSAGEQRQQEH